VYEVEVQVVVAVVLGRNTLDAARARGHVEAQGALREGHAAHDAQRGRGEADVAFEDLGGVVHRDDHAVRGDGAQGVGDREVERVESRGEARRVEAGGEAAGRAEAGRGAAVGPADGVRGRPADGGALHG